ncbi:protein HUA2-LIKE 3-like [Aristolochia californica]|uniref:protein HUA2-LIKE 3-like n=1 Tax=Aristolochia californica TaxID=171875 RepID=UPI0035D9A879
MAPGRRKGGARASAAAAAAARRQWKVGDLVLAKVKGFPAWPATVSEPQKWGYSTDWKKVLVYFFGTKQIAFCNPADVEAFTEEKKKLLLVKRQGKGADFVRAVDEIIDSYEKCKKQNKEEEGNFANEDAASYILTSECSKSKSWRSSPKQSPTFAPSPSSETQCLSITRSSSCNGAEIPEVSVEVAGSYDNETLSEDTIKSACVLNQLKHTRVVAVNSSRKRSRGGQVQSYSTRRKPQSVRRSRASSSDDPCRLQKFDDVAPDILSGGILRKNRIIGESPCAPDCHDLDLLVNSATVTSNGCGDVGSEIAPVDSEGVSCDENVTLKVEYKGGSRGMARLSTEIADELSENVDRATSTVVLEKKRKQNRKPTIYDTSACSRLDKEVGTGVKPCNNVVSPPNACEDSVDCFRKVDGDEHLPLVKRARARMGKPPLEGKKLDGISEKKINKETSVRVDTLPADRVLLGSVEAANTSPSKISSQSVGNNSPVLQSCLLLRKDNSYQLQDHSVDVEAALPPSKRLHRALKAMSANVAEGTEDIEAPRPSEMLSNGCRISTDNSNSSFLEAQNIHVNSVHCCHISTLDGCINTFHTKIVEEGNTIPVKLESGEEMCIAATEPQLINDCQDSPTNFHLGNSELCIKNPELCTSETDEKLSFVKTSASKQASPLDVENNKVLDPNKECSDVDLKGEGECSKEALDRGHGSLVRSMQRDEFFSADGGPVGVHIHSSIDAGQSIQSGGHVGYYISETMKISRFPSDGSNNQDKLQHVMEDIVLPRDRDISEHPTNNDLISAAQARGNYSCSTPDSASDDKVISDVVSSGLQTHVVAFSEQMSISSPLNDDRTPLADQQQKNSLHKMDELKHDLLQVDWKKPMSKLGHEANAVLKSFEDVVGTLTRTKESIGRATCLALDCAKYGLASEVVELLLQNLEGESSLYRRVDLFFLVDSITQCSRGQRGIVGDKYLSAVQTVLPRLLSAAAPPGNSARENRRQCLKVLRLWLERKTFPEVVVRHHIRELDSYSEAPYSSNYPRRSSRTERAINDPLREMEGMLVDEYGSNRSFQLPGFIMPHMLEDEDEECDTDEIFFEALTPERDIRVADDEPRNSPTVNAEKHRHILEDVDGELEMEDVAPPCDMEIDSGYHSVAFIPPMPEEIPPSPPPLPASPPPVAPPLPSSHPFSQPAMSSTLTSSADTNMYKSTHSMQNDLSQPMNLQMTTPSSKSTSTDSSRAAGYRDSRVQIPSAISSHTSGSCHSVRGSLPSLLTVNNSIREFGCEPPSNKVYHLQPPCPSVSNQFSYVHAESQQRTYPRMNTLPSTERFAREMQGRNSSGHRSRMSLAEHEIDNRHRFASRIDSDHSCSEKAGASYASYHGPPSEAVPNHEWTLPLRSLHYRHPVPTLRPPHGYPTSRSAFSRKVPSPNYWRPR